MKLGDFVTIDLAEARLLLQRPELHRTMHGGRRVRVLPGGDSVAAEQLADELDEVFVTYVYRFGSGNACDSGVPGNGVSYLELVRPRRKSVAP